MRKLLWYGLMALVPLSVDAQQLQLNDKGYLHTQGLDVTFFSDFYPEGHQSGVTIIQHGTRVAANGDVRLEPSPGQWSPIPKGDEVQADRQSERLSKRLSYPDENRHMKGFNPILYPDLQLDYEVSVEPLSGASFRISVHLDAPLPEEWIGKVGFNLELFPGELFGKSWIMDDRAGLFQLQPEAPLVLSDTSWISEPLATGRQLVIAPEDPYHRITIRSEGQQLELRDGRTNHNNGWYIVRSTVPAGATRNAVSWTVTPNVVDGWKYAPVIQVSQLGYHPEQQKTAIIEMDATEAAAGTYSVYKASAAGKELVKTGTPEVWGTFLRYKYATADFSDIREPGVYTVAYGEKESHAFRISEDIYSKHTWQPTLEYYLPVQMCHMRINEKYRVWHGVCHMDDALMAPTNHNHFDGYKQGPETMTEHAPGAAVPGLNRGGWHDAGDYDLRVESQAGTVRLLAWMIEEFGVEWDATLIDQDRRLVEIHVPDGTSDVVQQIEHGLLTILGGYDALGRLYRGIICQDLRQYVMLGDAASMTDNLVYDPALGADERTGTHSGVNDDRWVFTEQNPTRELQVAAALAAASRVLAEHDPVLADKALRTAAELWEAAKDQRVRPSAKVMALSELLLSAHHPASLESFIAPWAGDLKTARGSDHMASGESEGKAAINNSEQASGKSEQASGKSSRRVPGARASGQPIVRPLPPTSELMAELVAMEEEIVKNISSCGPPLSRVIHLVEDRSFRKNVDQAVAEYQSGLAEQQAKDSPYGVPYKPNIWGAGWTIQSFGVDQYFFHKGWPQHTPAKYFENALHFVLGVHPGANNASFASGVGANSVTVAYGVNRADWSFIPGGVASGTALIRPDLPEMKEWPFFWQQTEYVMGGGATNFMFLVLAVEQLYKEEDI
jgi:endoglucanase